MPRESGGPGRGGYDFSPKAGDYAASKRITRENEASQKAFYEDQMRSEGIDPATGLKASSAGTLSAIHSGIREGNGGTFAGAMLGALAFFTLRAYVEGRWAGVKSFYAAKFVNKTPSSPSPVPRGASGSAPTIGQGLKKMGVTPVSPAAPTSTLRPVPSGMVVA